MCAENFVVYMHEKHEPIQALIPRRRALPADRNILLLTSATHKMRNQFVILAQSEYGDIYKVRSDHNAKCDRVLYEFGWRCILGSLSRHVGQSPECSLAACWGWRHAALACKSLSAGVCSLAS